MTTTQTQECHAIIHSASALAAGVGSGIGNAINAATAGALTEALGWLLAKEFDEGIF